MNWLMKAWDWADGKKRSIAALIAAALAACQTLQDSHIGIPHLDLVIKGLGYAAGSVGSLGVAHAAWKMKMGAKT